MTKETQVLTQLYEALDFPKPAITCPDCKKKFIKDEEKDRFVCSYCKAHFNDKGVRFGEEISEGGVFFKYS